MIFIVKVLATMRDFVWFSAQYELSSCLWKKNKKQNTDVLFGEEKNLKGGKTNRKLQRQKLEVFSLFCFSYDQLALSF